MKNYQLVVIGFGKAGKTLAAKSAAAGQSVALIEKDALRDGGTCINVACIPTKFLENRAHFAAGQDPTAFYQKAIADKNQLTRALRQKNHDKVAGAGADVIHAQATFEDEHVIALRFPDGRKERIFGETIVINTGSQSVVPPIPGLAESDRVFTSDTLLDLAVLPKHLVIVGAGYIGLEFASIFTNFGAKVTILQHGDSFLPREDREIAASIRDSFTRRGITLRENTDVLGIHDQKDTAVLTLSTPEGASELSADAILIATGRRPNTDGLSLENAGVQTDARGAITVNAHLQTSVNHIYAVGDVRGGMQFTYLSLDDFRIVFSHLNGDGQRTAENRGAIPYTTFLDPPFSRIGDHEEQARSKGHRIHVLTLPAAAIPKANVLEKTDGLIKLIVDADDDQILGAHLFCAESHEIINIIKVLMDAHLPYTMLRDMIFTHPTISEAFNDLP
jgi:pyruvate/2-oxoglutarate dehydrogenase complex dihydrolipoamide dehydrogenase (E3) component